jgi:hypothetical protein
MKQNALQLDVAIKNKGRSSRLFLSTGSQIRSHSLGVLKLVTASFPAAAQIYMVIVIYVARVIVKPSFARVRNFESSQRGRVD